MDPLASDLDRDELDRAQLRSLLAGVVLAVICAGIAYASHSMPAFLRSYLIGFLFWLGIALGCLALLMMQHLTGGQWGFIIRRILEAGTGTLPLTCLLVIPLLAGMRQVYIWSAPGQMPDVNHTYLNPGFFLGRMAFYFLSWFLLGYYLLKWSREQDELADPMLLNRFQALSGGGLVLYGLTITFAAVDWVMSLEPHWISTIYGMLFMTEQGLAAFAFSIIVLMLLAQRKPISDVATPAHFHDLGTLMFAFVMLWAYVTFSQFLIIWAGNLLDEIPWYLRRFSYGWIWVGLAVVLFHFGLPFLLLLGRNLKRNMRLVAGVSALLLVMRLVNLYWMVLPAPTGRQDVGGFSWMDLVTPIALGAIWISLFIRQLKLRPLLPLHDPRLQEAALHHD